MRPLPTKLAASAGNTAAAAPLGVALALLSFAPVAGARRPAIEGRVAGSGYQVVALSPDGRSRAVRARRDFEVVPPARTVTLHLRDRDGVYLGPVVIAGRGKRAIVRVRAGARLGTIAVRGSYGQVSKEPRRRWRGRGRPVRATDGTPIGVGRLGLVRSTPRGPVGPGHDRDADGIPGLWDVDDDGDLKPDTAEDGAGGRGSGLRSAGGLAACVEPVCSGRISLGASSLDDMDTEVWLALAAALLAAASLGWQLGAALGRRRRDRIEVEARLGLPVYSQGGGRWAIFIEVTNGSEHPIRWVSASLELGDGRDAVSDGPPSRWRAAGRHTAARLTSHMGRLRRGRAPGRGPAPAGRRRGEDGVGRGVALAYPAPGRQAHPVAGLGV